MKPTEDPNVRSTFFTAWLSMYRTFVLPCYEQGECALDGTVTYDDGSTAKFDAEVTRIVAMYRASDGLTFGATSDCEQEHGAALALFSARQYGNLHAASQDVITPCPGMAAGR